MEKQMKNQSLFTRPALRKLAVAAFFAIASLGPVKAQSLVSKSTDARISYVGTADNKYVFEVNYTNDGASNFLVEVKDESGYQFYSGKFKAKEYKQKFAIAKDDLQNSSITFIISAKGVEKEQTFDVNSTYRLVEEVRVVKL